MPIFVPYASPNRLKEWFDLARDALMKKENDEDDLDDAVERHIQDVYV